MAASFLRDHPELRQLVLNDVRLTGRSIGAGSYGSVEEVEILGEKCAVREINDFFENGSHIPDDQIRRASEQFVKECQMMSTIRHAKIVEFLGVCFFPEWRLPAIVMERLQVNLYDVLEPVAEGRERPDGFVKKRCIELTLKCSILKDVAEGLAFLHSRTPPIIHGDLTARNVLLTVDMTAKIADLGVARIVHALQKIDIVTKTSIYTMPPEARENEVIYDASIDIFSFGVLAIFTLSQTFPKPLSVVYMDENMKVHHRTELERRGSYMQTIKKQLREEHPLILMIQNCLKDLPEDRPLIGQTIEFLSQARESEAREMSQDEEGASRRLKQLSSIIENAQIFNSSGKKNLLDTNRFSFKLENLEQMMRADEEQPRSSSKSQLSPLQMWEQAFIEWDECEWEKSNKTQQRFQTQQRSQKEHKPNSDVLEPKKPHLMVGINNFYMEKGGI